MIIKKLFILCFLALPAANVDAKDKGQWTLSEDSVLTVAIDKYSGYKANEYPWYGQRLAIRKIVIAEGVKKIRKEEFADCENLVEVEIPSSVSSVAARPFIGCNRLTTIAVNPQNKKFDSRDNCNAIIDTKDKELILGCKGTRVPGGIEKIGDEAFFGYQELGIITIPEGVKKINDKAFAESSLRGIELPSTLEKFNASAFARCRGLEIIRIAPNNVHFDSRDKCNAIIETKDNRLILGCKATVIPNSVTKIKSFAFEDRGLQSIEIPASVTKLENLAFAGCDDLESISVDSRNTVFDSRDNCNAVINTKANSLVVRCKNTVIPLSVSEIGFGAYYKCQSLTSIDLPEHITVINNSAFEGCNGLTSIFLPDNVKKIGDDVFRNCTNVTEAFLPKNMSYCGERAFENCINLKTVSLQRSADIRDYAFNNCKSLNEIYIPDYSHLGVGVFKECTNLTYISLPEHLQEISPRLFERCRSLNEVFIPEEVQFIGNNAFEECYHLTKIELPEGLKGIGDEAFISCQNLKCVILPSTILGIGHNAFRNCQNGLEIHAEACFIPARFNLNKKVNANADPFSGIRAKVYIPSGTLPAYLAAWGNRHNYIEVRPRRR
ncbi:MAG: leucine-rich repeat domain-containing protein [Bacteroidaceae bacterium]|nr:leucine-rich repeat domain-containing protein [Bacteroidaceae bacterium]